MDHQLTKPADPDDDPDFLTPLTLVASTASQEQMVSTLWALSECQVTLICSSLAKRSFLSRKVRSLPALACR